jgi:hypothetical protein
LVSLTDKPTDDRPFEHWPNTLPRVYLLCSHYVRTFHCIEIEHEAFGFEQMD